MSTAALRWLLAPRTSWRAWRLIRSGEGDFSFDTAWRRIRIDLHPDEMPYRYHGHVATNTPDDKDRLPWS